MALPSGNVTTKVPFIAYDAVTGNKLAGLSTAGFTAKGSLQGAAQSTFATTTVTESGGGKYWLTLNEQTTLSSGTTYGILQLEISHSGGTMAVVDKEVEIDDSASGATYAKDDVNDKRTWTFTKNTNSTKSPRIVTVHPDFDGTLKFDLTNVLNSGAGINAITSVTVDPTGPTVSGPNGNANPAKTSDNRCVLFDVDGAQIDNTDYTFTCTVTTTDSDDALVVTGVMKARSV